MPPLLQAALAESFACIYVSGSRFLRRLLRLMPGLAGLILIVAGIVLETRLGTVRDWAADHPFTTGVIGAAALLAITVTAIDRRRARAEARLWHTVAHRPLSDLGARLFASWLLVEPLAHACARKSDVAPGHLASCRAELTRAAADLAAFRQVAYAHASLAQHVVREQTFLDETESVLKAVEAEAGPWTGQIKRQQEAWAAIERDPAFRIASRRWMREKMIEASIAGWALRQ